MTMRLDISIGPVQGFVAQSRRTRDLWGSSYLLSFLAAHAMHGAQQAGGRITRPVVGKDPLYLWVSGAREGGAPPMGTLPNHFVLEGGSRRAERGPRRNPGAQRRLGAGVQSGVDAIHPARLSRRRWDGAHLEPAGSSVLGGHVDRQ